MRHKYDLNLVCKCGRTKEQHEKIDAVNEKVRERWVNGEVNLDRDFGEIDEALQDNK